MQDLYDQPYGAIVEYRAVSISEHAGPLFVLRPDKTGKTPILTLGLGFRVSLNP